MIARSFLRHVGALFLPLGACAASTPTRVEVPAVYLVGEDWIGRWEGGAMTSSVALPDTRIQSIVPDGRDMLWLLTYPGRATSDQAADQARIVRYHQTTLAAGKAVHGGRFETAAYGIAAIWPSLAAGQVLIVRTSGNDAQAAAIDTASLAPGPWRATPPDAVEPRIRAGRWLAPAPGLVGIDSDAEIDPVKLLDARTLAPARPDWLPAGAQLLALSRDVALILPAPGTVQVVALADGKIIDTRSVAARTAGDLRAALAPDGSTAILFTRPASPDRGDAWPGTAWEVQSGKTLPARDLAIDTGAGRESGQRQSLACLLPKGAGAIFSLIGQPADRESLAVLFDGVASRRVPLKTNYVSRCILADAP